MNSENKTIKKEENFQKRKMFVEWNVIKESCSLFQAYIYVCHMQIIIAVKVWICEVSKAERKNKVYQLSAHEKFDVIRENFGELYKSDVFLMFYSIGNLGNWLRVWKERWYRYQILLRKNISVMYWELARSFFPRNFYNWKVYHALFKRVCLVLM